MNSDNWTEEQFALANSAIAIKRPTPHTSMFKYVSLDNDESWEYFEQTLNQENLVGSAIKNLNDPFEGSPNIIDDLSPRVLEAVTGISSANQRSNRDKTDTSKKSENLLPYKQEAEAFISASINKSRIISFSERSDSPLLWSHYANSYRGACFHFLGRAFESMPLLLGYVSYSNHRPICPLSLALKLSSTGDSNPSKTNNLRNIVELSRFCYFTKASDWAYENEIRFVYDGSNQDSFNFNPDGLVSIITGPKMEPGDISKLKSIVKNSSYPNLLVRSSSLSPNSFSVKIKDNK